MILGNQYWCVFLKNNFEDSGSGCRIGRSKAVEGRGIFLIIKNLSGSLGHFGKLFQRFPVEFLTTAGRKFGVEAVVLEIILGNMCCSVLAARS